MINKLHTIFLYGRYRFLFFLFIANVFFLIANLQFIFRIMRTPAGYHFPLVHFDWQHDYYAYLSVINQGKEGFWLNRPAFTSEQTTAGIFYIYYIFVGKMAYLLHLDIPVSYHLSRFLSFELFAFSLYGLLNLIVAPHLVIWTSLTIFLSTVAPIFLFPWSLGPAPPPAIPWWIDFDAFERLNAVTHHIFGQALLLLFFYLTIKFIKSHKLSFALGAGFIAFISGIIFTPVLMPMFIVFPLAFWIYVSRESLYKNRLPIDRKMIIGVLIVVTIAFLSFIFMKLQEIRGFPWNAWRSSDLFRWNLGETGFNLIALLILAIPAIFSLPAFISVMKKGSLETLVIAVWAFLPFLMLPLAKSLGIPRLRILEESPFVPLGILTVLTFACFKKNKVVRYMLIIIFLLLQLPTTFWLLLFRINLVRTNSWYNHMYLSNDVYSAVQFSKLSIPKNSIILSDPTMGNVLPGLTLTKSYCCHLNQTMDVFLKQKYMTSFFAAKLDDQEAKRFLNKNRIRYIYFGSLEKSIAQEKELDYSFLKPIFRNKTVSIFEVED